MGYVITLILVVSYSISTSNHNLFCRITQTAVLYLIPFLHQTTTQSLSDWFTYKLYLIPFLHQTTTDTYDEVCEALLYLIPFLHQTTTTLPFSILFSGCILFHFYIKPQPTCRNTRTACVVSYSISTSNHNGFWFYFHYLNVVSYSISTSNHN